MKSKLMAFAAAAALLTAALALPASAGDWKQDHPRRAEVNGRLNNQKRRANQGVKNGKLNKKQAHRIHHEDRVIRHEERHMAKRDGGHITKSDKRKLNRQENRVSRQINRDESRNGSNAGGAPGGSPATPATPATPANSGGPGGPATPATPASPAAGGQ